MKLIQTIKDIIFKIKDYDRLELDYSAALDYATGGVMSKTNYTREAIYETIYEHWKKRIDYAWHEMSERPDKNRALLVIMKGENFVVMSSNNDNLNMIGIRWAYLDDLKPTKI